MSQSTKTYVLSKVKQLIDLNGDSINFNLNFKVTSRDDTPFQVLVVDQTTLDNSEELKYKDAKNSISGNIIADKNIYQNYFLILKSNKECTVDVELTKNDLPKTPDKIESSKPLGRKMLIPSDPSSFSWKKIAILTVVVISGLALLWYFYKKGTLDQVNYNTPSFTTTGVVQPNPNPNPNPNIYQPGKFNLQQTKGDKQSSSIRSNQSISSSISSSSSYKSKDGGGGKSLSILERLRNAKM